MYFGGVLPGSTNDSISYPLAVGLKDTAESLPVGIYCIVNAADTVQENLLILFTGVDWLDAANDYFYFNLLQLQICEENGIWPFDK